MERLLITQSLISSWDYIYSCRNEFVDTAKEEFLKTLRREPRNPMRICGRGLNLRMRCIRSFPGKRVPLTRNGKEAYNW